MLEDVGENEENESCLHKGNDKMWLKQILLSHHWLWVRSLELFSVEFACSLQILRRPATPQSKNMQVR